MTVSLITSSPRNCRRCSCNKPFFALQKESSCSITEESPIKKINSAGIMWLVCRKIAIFASYKNSNDYD